MSELLSQRTEMAGALPPADLVRPVLIQTPLRLPRREPRPRAP